MADLHINPKENLMSVSLSPQQAAVVVAAADGVALAVVGERVGISRAQAAGRLSEAYRRLDVAWLPAGERRAAAYRAAVAAGLVVEPPP